jgi:fatty acid desaturase
LSSAEWILEHLSSHHPFVNTPFDHDAISMLPIVDWLRARRRNVLLYPICVVGELVVALQGYAGHRCRWRAVPETAPAWLRAAPWLFVGRIALYIAAMGVMRGLIALIQTLCIASTYFSWLAHLNHLPVCHENANESEDVNDTCERCFVSHQLKHTVDLDVPVPSVMALRLDRQTMHHLFPTIDHTRLDNELRTELSAAAPNRFRKRTFMALNKELFRRLLCKSIPTRSSVF